MHGGERALLSAFSRLLTVTEACTVVSELCSVHSVKEMNISCKFYFPTLRMRMERYFFHVYQSRLFLNFCAKA
jgi:hypothetical protein